MLELHHVHPDLVGPTGMQGALHETGLGRIGQELKVGSGRLARMEIQINRGHAQSIHRISANGCSHQAPGGARPGPLANGQVLALHFPRGNGAHQRVHDRPAARHHHQATGVLVKTVHDAGARQIKGFGVISQQPVHQGT